MLSDEIAYVWFNEFAIGIADKVQYALALLRQQNPKLSSLIVDLRFNHGGNVDETISLLSLSFAFFLHFLYLCCKKKREEKKKRKAHGYEQASETCRQQVVNSVFFPPTYVNAHTSRFDSYSLRIHAYLDTHTQAEKSISQGNTSRHRTSD